jgi:hypothetical protein
MPDPAEWTVGIHQPSGCIDLAHCFFDLQCCFWSVVHPLAIEVFAPGEKDRTVSSR